MLSVLGTRAGGPAVDYTVNPAVGFPDATGPEGSSEPVAHVLPAWDCITGQMAATGLLAAERHRRITGEGQLVEMALKDVALAMLGNLGILGEVMVNGVDRPKYGNALFGAYGQDFADRRRPAGHDRGVDCRQWTGLLRRHRPRGRRSPSWAAPRARSRPGGRPVPGAQRARRALFAPWFAARRSRSSPPRSTAAGSPGRSSAPSPRPWPRIPTCRRTPDVRAAGAAGHRHAISCPARRSSSAPSRASRRAGAGAWPAHRRDPGRRCSAWAARRSAGSTTTGVVAGPRAEAPSRATRAGIALVVAAYPFRGHGRAAARCWPSYARRCCRSSGRATRLRCR